LFNEKQSTKLKTSNFIQTYLDNLEKYIRKHISSLKNWNILLDTANGSLSKYAKVIYRKFNAKVEVINNKPNGFNINYKCGSTNIEEFKAQYSIFSKRYPNSIGFTFDGDGDRVIALIKINKNIHIIYGDTMLFFISKYFKDILKLNINAVSLTYMSNLGIEKSFKKEGIKVVRTEVGDKYITESILNGHSNLGAEPSGHIVIPPFLYTGDGLLSSLLFLASMQYFNPEEIMPEYYPQKIINIKVADKHIFMQKNHNLFNKIQNSYNDVRIYVRPSGTEDVIRILIEAQDISKIEKIEKVIHQEVIVNVWKVSRQF